MVQKISRRHMLAGGAALGAAAGLGLGPKMAFADGHGKTKVGFIYIGPVGDHGWTYQHDQARMKMEDHFGGKVKTSYVENVPESADAERIIEQLAEEGNNLIFTTSFGYMNPTLKVARRYPDVHFEHATGYKQAKNVATYNGRFYEGRYVVGQTLGSLTKSNVIGYIASFPIPEVVMGINATLLGARRVNPNAEVKVVWVNSWFDPGKEADAAKALIDQGADILMQHTDSPAAMQVANDRGVWAVGQASDMSKFGPKAHVTAIVNNWAPYYIERTQMHMDGNWSTGDSWTGLKEGTVFISDYNSAIPSNIVSAGKKLEQDVKSGKVHPFAGPIADQKGTKRVAAGANADDGTLLGMDWFVDGVVGSVGS